MVGEGLSNQIVVFTRELTSMSRKEGQIMVRAFGGHVQRAVSEKTTVLVRGSIGILQKTTEELRVEYLRVRGIKIEVLNEQEFLIRLNQEIVKQIYTSNW